MLTLYRSGGASDFYLDGSTSHGDSDRVLLGNAVQVLRARGERTAANLLTRYPFCLVEASNHFNDDFLVLFAGLPIAEYESLRKTAVTQECRAAFRGIADVLAELGYGVRFIAVDLVLDKENILAPVSDPSLRQSEIIRLVNDYIGVSGGYLGDFTYKTHAEFYQRLDLNINPKEYEGTTRERFIRILSESSPKVQATILEGILKKYPVGTSMLRTPSMFDEVMGWILRLRGKAGVSFPDLKISSEVVERALSDAEELIRTTGATSGVDRVHTALHGYLIAVCADAGFKVEENASLTELFKALREGHPALASTGPRADEIVRLLRSLASIVDTLNPLRNKASVAHPNAQLLEEPEARLVIDIVRTILHYLDEKLCYELRFGEPTMP